MKRKATIALLAVVAGAVALTAALTRGPSPDAATASSHREAPLISEDPSADNTDLYAFRSLDAPDMLTVISNWNPGEDPAAGPMWYTFSPTARYNIYIDRDGDARADITYRFTFKKGAGVLFLRNTQQEYTVTRTENGQSSVVARGMTPPNNVGPRFLGTFFGTTNYDSLANGSIESLSGGGRVFAGQREDPFFGDIGAIFDAVAFRKDLGNEGGGKDFFAGYGVHTIAMQIPIEDIDDSDHIVGVWSTTDRRVVTVRGPKGDKRAVGRWVQVSRIGNPLFNEVIVPTDRKDEWNRKSPRRDSEFVDLVRTPILAALINDLYPSVNAPETDREDLVSVFLTGVPELNFTGNTQADMLRINLSIPPTDPASDGFSRLGVPGGDLAGWPNGRRLEDDVIDIAETAMAGFLLGNIVPLGDGVDENNVPFLGSFPYVPASFSGYENTKGNCDEQREEVGDFADPNCDG